MILETRIAQLVHNLPEVYQPIYGFSQFDGLAVRHSHNRLVVIQVVADQMRQILGRPLRVLDLGCAQGFFSLNMAVSGDEVYGIDVLTQNIELCNALAESLSLPNITFLNTDVNACFEKLGSKNFDLMLGFSIFHHICKRNGMRSTRQLIDKFSQKASICLIETALKEEPRSWASSQPKDPRKILSGFSYQEKIGEHNTHLSKIKRPLFFCSNFYRYINANIVTIAKNPH